MCPLYSFVPWSSINRLRETVSTEHTSLKQKELENMPKASHGYGGKFGVQQDRMDKVRDCTDELLDDASTVWVFFPLFILPFSKSCFSQIYC